MPTWIGFPMVAVEELFVYTPPPLTARIYLTLVVNLKALALRTPKPIPKTCVPAFNPNPQLCNLFALNTISKVAHVWCTNRYKCPTKLYIYICTYVCMYVCMYVLIDR